MSDDARGVLASTWGRVWGDRTSRYLAIGAGIFALLLAGTIVLAIAAASNVAALEAQRTELFSERAELRKDVAALENDVQKYKPAYDDSVKVKRDAGAVEKRETAVAEREAAAEQASVDVAAREAAVQTREQTAAANASAGDWWVSQVRECLARSGGLRMASVTEGNYVGRDLSCVTN